MKKKTRKTTRVTPKKASRKRQARSKKEVKRPDLRPAAPEPQKDFNDTRSAWQFPARYGQDALVLLVRDPWWFYAYWEVTPETLNRVKTLIRTIGLPEGKTVLRVYHVTGLSLPESHAYFDIEVSVADNWYVDVGLPDSEWIAEVGIRVADGRFFSCVRSNRIRTPRYGVSNVVDEEWMLPDDIYWKLFGHSAGVANGPSSFSVKDILERYFQGQGSSEQSRSVSRKK